MNKFDVFIADTFLNRFLGYMFRKTPHHQAILIKPCNSIHTFFMNFDIDVLFINKDMEVIKKINSLSKRKIIMPVQGAVAVMEAEGGAFKKIEIGEKMDIIIN
ncbi:MAG: DUF192 domain-containing protein [Clostridiaceae bacterium]|nr:DUF192 domain-containing protein [Clostridiaceae bacterium]